MENKEDNIEDLFRERFENDEVPVSPAVWQNIKKTLPEDKDRFGFSFSQNLVLWGIAGILLVSAIIGSSMHFYKNGSSPTVLYPSEQTVSKPSLTGSNIKSANSHAVNDPLVIDHSNSDHHVDGTRTKNRAYNNNIHQNHTSSASSTHDFWNEENSQSKKIGANAHHKSIASAEQKSKPRKKQKGVNSEQNDRTIANKKRHAEPTPDLLYRAKSQTSNNKKTDLKDSDQNTASLKSLLETKKQLQNRNTKDENNSIADVFVLSAQESETKRRKELDKNNLSLATDTTAIPSTIGEVLAQADSVSKNSSTRFKNESIFVLKDSLNQTNSISITDTHSLESLHAALSIKNKENTDSTYNYRETELMPADHTITKSDSSSSNLASSINQHLTKDSLSVIQPSISLNQDNSLIKLDSLQPVPSDSVLAKTTDNKEKGDTKLLSRMSFDILGTILLTGAITSTTATDSVYPSAVEDKNRNDKNSLGYSVGINVNYKINERFRASAGIGYTHFTEQYHFTYTLKQSYWVFIDTAWQQFEYDSIYKDFTVKDQYSFLSIPLQLSYTFLQKGKIKLSATLGLRSNILLKGVTYLANHRKDDVRKVTSGFNKISFMYQVALEAEYKWSDHTALLVQPVFLYGATSIHNKASTLQQKPYGMGLTVGLRFTF